MTKEATKHDTDKIRLELLPIRPLEEIAKVMTFGAKKYGDDNWRKGMKWSRVFGALLRHLFSWKRGENRDEESKLLTLAHAGCCILFLIEYHLAKSGIDDRKPLDTTQDI